MIKKGLLNSVSMKPVFVLLSLFLLLPSCLIEPVSTAEFDLEDSNGELATKSSVEIDKLSDFFVSEEMAVVFAELVFGKEFALEVSPCVVGGDTLMYVVASKDHWIVVSSDMRTNPILAEGRGVFNNEESNLAFNWLSMEAKSLSLLRRSNNSHIEANAVALWRTCDGIARQRKMHMSNSHNESYDAHWIVVLKEANTTRTTIESINHLIETKWGQGYPWNMKTPYSESHGSVVYSYAGCVAVAISQVLYYFNQTTGLPSGLHHSVIPKDISTSPNFPATYEYTEPSNRWELMSRVFGDGGNYEYVADLIAVTGARLNTDYHLVTENCLGSRANVRLSECGLLGTRSIFSFNDVQIGQVLANLRQSLPVIVATQLHCWIIDGYLHTSMRASTKYGYYYVEDLSEVTDTYLGYNVVSRYTDEEMFSLFPSCMNGSETEDFAEWDNQYFRMNWGENGEHDDDLYDCFFPSSWHVYRPENDENISFFYNLSTF